MAKEFWETDSYLQWSAEQVQRILNDSPWVSLIQAGYRKVVLPRCLLNASGIPVVVDQPPNTIADRERQYAVDLRILYQVRLLTARPVRVALLRRLVFYERAETSISVRDYETDTEKDRLERFISGASR